MNALTRVAALGGEATQATRQFPRDRPLVVGLVNNMPDAALGATERQFGSLLSRAAGTGGIVLRCYSLPEIPRETLTRQAIGQRYHSLQSLRDDPPDALVISGAAPVAPELRQEPYWQSLAAVLVWAESSSMPLVLSCLAAHAAVLHTHGVARRRLSRKCCGVFVQHRRADHPLLRRVGDALCTPHSRWNDVSELALVEAGYEILTGSDAAGVDIFVHPDRPATLFLNGHPEYDGNTLMKEYRRDVTRFLRGEQSSYPDEPHFEISAEEDATPWRALADPVFGNWIEHVRQRAA